MRAHVGSGGYLARDRAGSIDMTQALRSPGSALKPFIYALAFIQSSANKTVPVAILTELVSGDVYQWGALMAGSLLGSLPVALFYSLFVDYYVSSLTGAVKE